MSFTNYKIVGDSLRELKKIIEENKDKLFYLFIDYNVFIKYESELEKIVKLEQVLTYSVPDSESEKNFTKINFYYDKLLTSNITRDDYIVAIGGGKVGDLIGYIASTYKRGVKYINIPTTLLSQVDSALGGKVAVNYDEQKNMIGTFYEPEVVLISPNFLQTLSQRERKSGLAEIIKYAYIAPTDTIYKILLDEKTTLEEIFQSTLLSQKLIFESIEVKKYFVENDIFDHQKRQILNYGHTFGHSVEAKSKFIKYTHGEAIILGIVYLQKFLLSIGITVDPEVITTQKELFAKFNYEIKLPFKYRELEPYLLEDKKNTHRTQKIIVCKKRGQVEIVEIAFTTLKQKLKEIDDN